MAQPEFGPRDIKDTNQARAHRAAIGRFDVSSVVEVDETGRAVEKYKIGNLENLGVTEALEFMLMTENKALKS